MRFIWRFFSLLLLIVMVTSTAYGLVDLEGTPFSRLAPTTLMSIAELVGDNGVYDEYEDIPTPPASGTYKLVINIYYQFITVYKKDNCGNFSIPIRYMICTTGKRETPTPLGTFKVGPAKFRWAEFTGLNCWAQYWTQLTEDYYLHSIIYSKADANTYTQKAYRNLGKRVSHGCVRMWVPDARWVWYNIAPGTEIEVIKGEKTDEEAAAIRAQLVFPPYPKPRVQVKPGEIPVTEPWPGY